MCVCVFELSHLVLVLVVLVFFTSREFIEVETPVLQTTPGGASAVPFSTFLNELKLPVFLRVSPELYLKVGIFLKKNIPPPPRGFEPRTMRLTVACSNQFELQELEFWFCCGDLVTCGSICCLDSDARGRRSRRRKL